VNNFVPDKNKTLQDYINTIIETNKENPNYSKFKFIFKKCKNWIKTLHPKKYNPKNLAMYLRLAIALFCWDIQIHNQKHLNFYYVLNEMLRERVNAKLESWGGYLYYFQSALSKFERKEITTYRGIPQKDKETIKEEYAETRIVHFSAYSSTTSNLETAKDFASIGGVILCFKLFDAISISDYSPYPNESEYLLSPNMSFIVMNELSFDPIIGLETVKLTQKKKKVTFVY